MSGEITSVLERCSVAYDQTSWAQHRCETVLSDCAKQMLLSIASTDKEPQPTPEKVDSTQDRLVIDFDELSDHEASAKSVANEQRDSADSTDEALCNKGLKDNHFRLPPKCSTQNRRKSNKTKHTKPSLKVKLKLPRRAVKAVKKLQKRLSKEDSSSKASPDLADLHDLLSVKKRRRLSTEGRSETSTEVRSKVDVYSTTGGTVDVTNEMDTTVPDSLQSEAGSPQPSRKACTEVIGNAFTIPLPATPVVQLAQDATVSTSAAVRVTPSVTGAAKRQTPSIDVPGEDEDLVAVAAGPGGAFKDYYESDRIEGMFIGVAYCGTTKLLFRNTDSGNLHVPKERLAAARMMTITTFNDMKANATFDEKKRFIEKAIHNYARKILDHFEDGLEQPIAYASKPERTVPTATCVNDFLVRQPEPLHTAYRLAWTALKATVKFNLGGIDKFNRVSRLQLMRRAFLTGYNRYMFEKYKNIREARGQYAAFGEGGGTRRRRTLKPPKRKQQAVPEKSSKRPEQSTSNPKDERKVKNGHK